MERILVVDDEPGIAQALSLLLRGDGYEVAVAGAGTEARGLLDGDFFDLVLSDIRMPGYDGFELLRHIRATAPATAVILMTSFASVGSAVEAMQDGASDYITKPFLNEQIRVAVRRALGHRQLARENVVLRAQVGSADATFEGMVGRSASMRALFELVERIAPTRSNVLVTGESGTGKGVVARAIHARSSVAGGPFVSVNCAAIPEDLLESALFGHVRGAFTSAYATQEGFFKAADGGTLFLDEITEIPPHLQVKLLHAIQDKAFVPTGATRPLHVSVRILAASNANVPEKIASGAFRKDLYYRLNIFELHVPALRDRREDVPALVAYFVGRFATELRRDVVGVEPAALAALTAYDWPGNVRELENAIDRAVALSRSSVIRLGDLPPTVLAGQDPDHANGTWRSLDDQVADFERAVIRDALTRTTHDKNAAARLLGVNLTTLYRKMAKLGLDPREFRRVRSEEPESPPSRRTRAR